MQTRVGNSNTIDAFLTHSLHKNRKNKIDSYYKNIIDNAAANAA
jgi:hypothetical protein